MKAHSAQSITKNNLLRVPRRIIFGIYFLSGACSLVYEVIWRRLLKLTLGNTTYATSITIAVFLAGLALGALLVRNRADSIRNKLRVYAGIELLISLTAVLIPFALSLCDGAYAWIFQRYSPSPPAMLILQIAVSSLILLVPAILMGTTLPILSAWIVRRAEWTGRLAGRLYATNTLGALAGTFVSGFYLIRLLGISTSYYIAIVLNLMLAGLAWVLSRRAPVQQDAQAAVALAEESTVASGRSYPQQLVLVWLFVSGFVALGYEVLWVRSIVHYLGAEIYVFSAVLCVYLLGYSLGVAAGSRLLSKLDNLLGWSGMILQLVGLCGLLYMPVLVNTLDPGLMHSSSPFYFMFRIAGFFLHLSVSMVLFLVPSFLMGLGFPLLIQMRSRGGSGPGGTIAQAYSINTIGCVLGALAAGFVLVPWLGAQGSIQLLGGLAVLCGLGVLLYRSGTHAVARALAPVVIGFLALALFPRDGFVSWINVCEGKDLHEVELVDVTEGINTTASVHRYVRSGVKVISSAGINVAGDEPRLRETQKVQGHVPLILHGNPKKVLTVGFGSGELTRCLTFHEIPSITCVEIAPEMVALSKKHFSHINLGNQLEEKVRVIYMDAKNYIHLTDERYDVILNDSIWPGHFAESSSLYTREHFEDGKRLLNEGGVYSTWLPLRVPTPSFMSILRAFTDVFENTVIVYPHSYPSMHLLLVGCKDTKKYSYTDMRAEFGKPAVAESMAVIGVERMEDVVDFLLADHASMAKWAAESPANTDDFPVVEFDVERRLRQPSLEWNMLRQVLENTERADIEDLLSFEGLEPYQRSALLSDRARRIRANEHLYQSYIMAWGPKKGRATVKEVFAEIDRGLAFDPGNPHLLRTRQEFLALIPPSRRTDFRLTHAETLLRERRPAEALPLLQELLRTMPGDARVQRGIGVAHLLLKRPDQAVGPLSRVVDLDPTWRDWFILSTAQALLGRTDEAIASAEQALALAEQEGRPEAERIRLRIADYRRKKS